jgi:hypothetical protein
LGKRVFSAWCFDGEFVVRCVVERGVSPRVFLDEKCATFLGFIFVDALGASCEAALLCSVRRE